MKRKAKRCLCSLAICTLLAGTVQAQTDGGSARVSDQPGPLPALAAPVYATPGFYGGAPQGGLYNATPVETVFNPRLTVDNRSNKLYGYENGYSTIGGFLPYRFEENSLLFADGRGMVTYDGRGGASLGLGWRHYAEDFDRIFGVSTWYDFDAGHVRSYNQVGLSFESLGRYFDMRLNGYIPVGEIQNKLSTTIPTTPTSRFSGHQLLFQTIGQYETAYTGFDAEIGGPMPLLGQYGLSGYAGFYFFTSNANNGDFTGVSGRLSWQVNEDALLGFQATQDHQFGTNVQVQLAMTLPDGGSTGWFRPLRVRDRLMQNTFRNTRVTVQHVFKVDEVAAINPKDGLPYFVQHIDPNGALGVPNGDGSVEHPFRLLSQFDTLPTASKANVDIVMVRPRTDGSSGNLNTGVTLLDGQRLLSTSVSHGFTVAQLPGTIFNIPVPANQLGQPLPLLANAAGGNVVTLASGSTMVEVSGFRITGNATGSGIIGSSNQAVLINNNVIENGVNGIALTNLSGLSLVGMESRIENNIIRGNTTDGVSVVNTGAAPLSLIIANNNPKDVNGNVITDYNGDGVKDLTDSLDGDSNQTNDGIFNNGNDGIKIVASNSVIATSIDNNLFQGAINNAITGNGNNGLELRALSKGVILGAIDNNTITNQTHDGIAMVANAGTIDFFNVVDGKQGEIRHNVIAANGKNAAGSVIGTGNGIDVLSLGGSKVSLGVFNNTIGAALSADDPPQGTAAQGNAGIGLHVNATDTTAVLAIGAPNNPGNPPAIPAVINSNDFGFNAVSGIDINVAGASKLTYNIDNNRVVNAFTSTNPPPRDAVSFTFPGTSGPNGVPFEIDNLSDPGINITQVVWNLNGSLSQFDSDNRLISPLGLANGNTLSALQPTGQSDLATGLVSINNNPVFSGTNPLQLPPNNAIVGPNIIPDASTTLSLEFNGFGGNTNANLNSFAPQSAFTATTLLSRNVPVLLRGDTPQNAAAAANSTVTVTFSNGLTTSLVLRPIPNSTVGVEGQAQVFGASIPGAGTGTDGIHVSAAGSTLVNPSTISLNTVEGYGGNGIHVETSGTAQAANVLIQSNNVKFNGIGFASGSVATFTGAGIAVKRDGSSTLDVTLDSNTIGTGRFAANFNDGVQLLADGTAIGGLQAFLTNNTITNNAGNGVYVQTNGFANMDITTDTLNGNNINFNNRNNFEVHSFDNSVVNIDLENASFANATGTTQLPNTPLAGFGWSGTADGQSTLNVTILNSVFDNNVIGGFQLNANANGLARVNIQNSDFSNNAGDGLSFNRNGASLILATVTNSTMLSNGDDGVQFYASGSADNDPNTPLYNPITMSAPASRLVLIGDTLNLNGIGGVSPNGGNGLETATFGDAYLIVNALSTTFSNNSDDGVRAFVKDFSSFGNRDTGERSTFDNVTLSNNGNDGMKVFVQGNFSSVPTALVGVSSLAGQTLIQDNGDDGIEGTVTYGNLDLKVESGLIPVGNSRTFIQRNGQTTGINGNGIEFNVGDAATDGDDTNGPNSVAQFFFPFNPVTQTYWEMIQPSSQPILAVGKLNVSNVVVGDENLADAVNNGNFGDGVQIHDGVPFVTMIGNGLTRAQASQVAPNYADRFLGGTNPANLGRLVGTNSLQAAVDVSLSGILPASKADVFIHDSDISNNGNNGINIVGTGNQAYLKPVSLAANLIPGSINDYFETQQNSDTPSADGLRLDSDINGPSVQLVANIANNRIEQNTNNGISISITGQSGFQIFNPNSNTNARIAENRIRIDGNLIQQNGLNGVFFQANAASQAFQRVDFVDPQPTNPGAPYIPANIGLADPFLYNAGFASDVILSDYLDITSRNVTNMVITNNIIQQNGGIIPNQGDGVFVRVSSDSFLSLDMGGVAGGGTGNTFLGNTLADFHVESFIQYQERPDLPAIQGVPVRVYENPPASRPKGPPPLDIIFLDHTAQMDLRFNNNSGNEVSAPFAFFPQQAAVYLALGGVSQEDLAAPSGKGLGSRAVQIFQVDDAADLDANNTWAAQALANEFSLGNFHLRLPPPDPLFANPAFPQPWFVSPGNPFLP